MASEFHTSAYINTDWAPGKGTNVQEHVTRNSSCQQTLRLPASAVYSCWERKDKKIKDVEHFCYMGVFFSILMTPTKKTYTPPTAAFKMYVLL